MLNAEPQGGWGAGMTTATPNPFNTAATVQSTHTFAIPPPNPFAVQDNVNAQATAPNPFAASNPTPNPFSSHSGNPTVPAPNPFAVNNQPSKPAPNPFAVTRAPPSVSPFTTADGPAPIHNPFNTAKPQSVLAKAVVPSVPSPAPPKEFHGSGVNGVKKVAEFVQPAWSTKLGTPTTMSRGSMSHNSEKGDLTVRSNSQAARRSPAPNSKTKTFRGKADTSVDYHDGRSRQLAKKIHLQLSKDKIKPPTWPANPGSHAQRQAMDAFREAYRTYREKARKSLIRAGLIDDPDRRRKLDQALDFRGTCEDMCPEWEKITRITEYDVRLPEKATDSAGDLVAIPSLMVKRLARSAAGQDAPLPMDVRSFATLRKTLDYLIDDLISDDSSLPSKHNFLWDRTRAIRIDLSVQKYNLTPDERTDLVYCLETIARFHVTALHLLSQDGFAAEDFSEQQELEQLGKTLMSLKELYDDCIEQGVECPNEAEFRGYFIVFNARSPSIKETVEGWGTRLWNSDGIRTAMCLVESLQNTWSIQGPLNPYAPTELALGAAAIFFSIVSSPQISYTMACFAEIHFNDVRKTMIQVLRKSYTRPREGPKDITPAFLQSRLRFDTEDEAVDFAKKHGIVFDQDGDQPYAILNARQSVPEPRIRHAFSRDIVERKRSGRSLPDVIHHTVYQQEQDSSSNASQEDSLFVVDSREKSTNAPKRGLPNGNATRSSIEMAPPAAPLSTSRSTPVPSVTASSPWTSQSPFGSAASHPSIGQPTQVPTSQPSGPPLPAENTSIQNPGVGASVGSSIFGKPRVHFGMPDDSSNKITTNEVGGSMAPPSQGTGGATIQRPTSITSNTIFGNIFGSPSQPPKPSNLPRSASGLGAPEKPTSPSTFSFLKPAGATIPNPTSLLPSASPAPATTRTQQPAPGLSGPSIFDKKGPTNATGGNDASAIDRQPSSGFSSKSTASSLSAGESAAARSPTPAGGIMSPLSSTRSQSHVGETPSMAVPAAPAPKIDLMDKFARWFVLADKGLLEDQLEVFAVEHLLKPVWEEFRTAEGDRVRREKEEMSWAEALKFRHHTLKVRYFYRWLDISRKHRVVRRIRQAKEEARKWRLPSSVAAREALQKTKKAADLQEAKDLVGKRTKRHTEDVARLRDSTQSRQDLEDALLATGIFGGVRDERAAARKAVQDDEIDTKEDMLPAEKLRLRSENQRRRKRGLGPLKRLPEPIPRKEGSKTSLLRAISHGAGRDSLSMSTNSLRHSTYSSSYRSSLGFNQSRIAKPRSNVTDPYWRMKANGLVLMPNGEYLHESLALPMLREGKRFPGIGDYGLPPLKTFTPSQSPPAGLDIAQDSTSTTPVSLPPSNRASRSASVLEGVGATRKRGRGEDEDLAAYRNEAPASHKRAKSGGYSTPEIPSEDQDFLARIASLLNRVEAVAKTASPS
ncbi:hypothetical protein GGS20DRAFT_566365 [Poronia punctata]|nr:hypothetical protein GGS20DRAFT_566365 [Poronia punctata]